MSKLICPECGEEIKEGQLVCDNCNYHLPQPATPSAPVKPASATPVPQAPTKPGKAQQGGSVAMPESIMSHGDVAVNNSHAEDNSVHTDNSVQNNVQTNTNVQHSVTDNSQTVNNTNQTVNNNTTILIMGGGNAPLPAGMDENTANAVRQAQQQMSQQPAHQPQRQPQHAQPAPQDQPQDGQKGIGSIAGGAAYTPTTVSSSTKSWITIAIIAVIVIGGAVLFFTGEDSDKPAQTTEVVEVQEAQPQKKSTKNTASKPAKKTTAQASENVAPSTAAVASASPAKAVPARDAHYDAGMNYYNAGQGLEAVREFKASGSKASLLMLSKIYEEGCGSVEANAMMAMKYKKEANNK